MTKLSFSGINERFPSHFRRKFQILLLALISTVAAYAQQATINGTVLDENSTNSIIGATVRLKGQQGGTVTDAKGNFSLNAKTLPVTLLISGIGYKTQEIDVYEAEPITVNLAEEQNRLSEVVVTALGISKEKKSLGYTI